MDKKLDPIASNLSLLLDSNIEPEEFSLFMKLFGVSPKVNPLPCLKKQQEKSIRIKPIKHINTSQSIGNDWAYLETEHLTNFLMKENSDFIFSQVKHHWVEHDHTDLMTATEKEDYKGYHRTVEYEGDSHNLVDAILKMLPNKWDDKISSVPFSFILPYNNKFNIDEFDNEGVGWDIFNLSEEKTKTLFSTLQGSLTFSTILQLTGLTKDAITSILMMTGSLKSHISTNHSFEALYKRYPDEKVDGLYLSPNARDELFTLMGSKKCFSNDDQVIIPTFDFKSKSKKKLTRLRTIVGDSSKATENDMVAIRGTLSYLMSHGSGAVVTLNIPIDGIGNRSHSTPTLILPKRWEVTVNAHRPSHTKDVKDFKKQMALDYDKQLTDAEIKELYLEYIEVTSFLNVDLTRAELNKYKKISTATNKKFSRIILGAGYSKVQFPMRIFPNPEYPEHYPKKTS